MLGTNIHRKGAKNAKESNGKWMRAVAEAMHQIERGNVKVHLQVHIPSRLYRISSRPLRLCGESHA
jgi:hypothetical protein